MCPSDLIISCLYEAFLGVMGRFFLLGNGHKVREGGEYIFRKLNFFLAPPSGAEIFYAPPPF